MTAFHIVGIALIVIGVVEFVVFRLLASSRPNIARILPFLMANSAFNVILGIVFLLFL